ncbi:MAG TPA: acyl-CoA dehydrogenase family protein [Mycobacteriales bacterium]|nr:acyl-CoA dehydrogenase family protein [Mycobacteriales bacterium]
MDFSEPAHWQEIRRQAEDFVAQHVTPDVIAEERRTGDGVNRAVMRELGRRGWIAPAWPVEEGGAGLDPFEAGVLTATLRAGGVPTTGHGTTMLPANAIRALGSAELKRRVLPGVAAGETLICLGYTEPAGGSDVFACATTARRDDGRWVINGQKMFTTFAHRADYCFLLTRSVPESRGGQGLTVFLVPLPSAGVEIRPVRTIGFERTNLVFWTDVHVGDEWVVGEPHEGLAVMRAALQAEHSVAPASRTEQVWLQTRAIAAGLTDDAGRSLTDDPLVRIRLARMALDAEVASLLTMRAAVLEAAGAVAGPGAALWGPESYVRAAINALDIIGSRATLDWPDADAPLEGALAAHYRAAVATTIYGGSSEVLRSLIAEQRLGLPRSRPKQ